MTSFIGLLFVSLAFPRQIICFGRSNIPIISRKELIKLLSCSLRSLCSSHSPLISSIIRVAALFSCSFSWINSLFLVVLITLSKLLTTSRFVLSELVVLITLSKLLTTSRFVLSELARIGCSYYAFEVAYNFQVCP